MEILPIVIGWDSREPLSFDVCRHSFERRTSKPLHIIPLMQKSLRMEGLYWRKHEQRDGILWDTISGAPMSTEFAVTRFLLPHILPRKGWALFAESDMLAQADIAELFDLADPAFAVMCVKHRHEPKEARKMDGQPQVHYARKNWSSFVLWNMEHKAHDALTTELVNTLPGRDLHGFCWLHDDQIGSLPAEWNVLVQPGEKTPVGKVLHYTNGTPELTAGPWLREAAMLHRPLPSEWRAA